LKPTGKDALGNDQSMKRGTSEDPFQIATAEDLVALGLNVADYQIVFDIQVFALYDHR
jgi:hypothetical protein